jgi:hypothetical protein
MPGSKKLPTINLCSLKIFGVCDEQEIPVLGLLWLAAEYLNAESVDANCCPYKEAPLSFRRLFKDEFAQLETEDDCTDYDCKGFKWDPVRALNPIRWIKTLGNCAGYVVMLCCAYSLTLLAILLNKIAGCCCPALLLLGPFIMLAMLAVIIVQAVALVLLAVGRLVMDFCATLLHPVLTIFANLFFNRPFTMPWNNYQVKELITNGAHTQKGRVNVAAPGITLGHIVGFLPSLLIAGVCFIVTSLGYLVKGCCKKCRKAERQDHEAIAEKAVEQKPILPKSPVEQADAPVANSQPTEQQPAKEAKKRSVFRAPSMDQ